MDYQSTLPHRILNRLFRCEDLRACPTDAPYLYRWIIFKRPSGRACYIHHIVGPDWGRDPHDHPKTFVSIGLAGHYVEEVYFDPNQTVRSWQAPWFRIFGHDFVHRITEADAWTLIFTGREMFNWGFWLRKVGQVTWVRHDVYIAGVTKDC